MHSSKKVIGFFLGLGLFLVILLGGDLHPGTPQVTSMAAVALLMAVWWISEALPIPATALVPVVLFPALGLMPGKAVATQYMNSTIFLFLGGFMLAIALERSGLHRRAALLIVRAIGTDQKRIVLAFMIAAGFLSMWISNTASAVIMLPIALSFAASHEEHDRTPQPFEIALMLGIAYACSVGGIATIMGTPPNIALISIYSATFPLAPEITFVQWMVVSFPLAAGSLVAIWAALVYFLTPIHTDAGGGVVTEEEDYVDRQIAELGPLSKPEFRTLVIFLATAFLWIFREPLPLGVLTIPGWAQLFQSPDFIDDGTVAIFAAIALFVTPDGTERTGRRLLSWEATTKVPWGILLLFGGGFALAAGFKESGLSLFLGSQLEVLKGAPVIVLVFALAIMMTFLTELTSNTATTQMLLPILASLGVAMGVNPLIFMIPATYSASCAFMLPVATPPNAIVFGSGLIPIERMARVGLVLNLAGAVLVTLYVMFVVRPLMGLGLEGLPVWAM